MARRWRYLMAIWMGLAGTAAWPALADERFRVLTEDFPPYQYLDAAGNIVGHDVEVTVEAFRRVGREIEVEILPWRRVLHIARQGEALGIITCAYTDARNAFLTFSNPLSTFTSSFIARAGYAAKDPRNLGEAKGRSIASVTDYESLSELRQAGFDPIEAPNLTRGLWMLIEGRFDYLYVLKETTMFRAAEFGVADRIRYTPLMEKPFFFCFSRAAPGVEGHRQAFNQGLAEVRADGTYAAIHARYLSTDAPVPSDRKMK